MYKDKILFVFMQIKPIQLLCVYCYLGWKEYLWEKSWNDVRDKEKVKKAIIFCLFDTTWSAQPELWN